MTSGRSRILLAYLIGAVIFLPCAAVARHRQVSAFPAAAWNRFIEGVVERDSQNWLVNRFDRGSVSNSQRLATSADGHTVVVAAIYTFNNGAQGGVGLVVTDSHVQCVEYWDVQGECRSAMPPDLLAWYDQPGSGNTTFGYRPNEGFRPPAQRPDDSYNQDRYNRGNGLYPGQ